jgi:hypothetical protein
VEVGPYPVETTSIGCDKNLGEQVAVASFTKSVVEKLRMSVDIVGGRPHKTLVSRFPSAL